MSKAKAKDGKFPMPVLRANARSQASLGVVGFVHELFLVDIFN